MTVTEAATEVGRSERMVRYWISAGLLVPVGKNGRAKLYDLDDVLRVERDTRATETRLTLSSRSCRLRADGERMSTPGSSV